MRDRPSINRLFAKNLSDDAAGYWFRGELPHTPVMDAEQLAGRVVATHVLSIDDAEERKSRARQLIAYSIAALVTLEGDKAAAEFVYRAADATVGVA